MSPPRRVVLDTSTLVSAALKTGSVPHQALLQALARCEVCASVQTWRELDQVLQRDRFNRYLPRDLRAEFVVMMRKAMHFFAVTPADEMAVHPPCRDARDNKFLALVQVCQADVLVSSDDDLLVLHPWQGVPVLRPADLLAHLEAP
jgi:putative PIN family toxin of toxin-antitoxin system